jgi:hypothetical protein
VRSFSRDEDKHKTVNKGWAAIRRGKSMGKAFAVPLVPVLGGAMPGGTPVIVPGRYIMGYNVQFLE